MLGRDESKLSESVLTWYTRAELARVLRDQVIINAILQRTQNYDRAGVANLQTLDRFVGQDVFLGCCKSEKEKNQICKGLLQ